MNARVDITPRKPKFDFSDIDRKWYWADNSLLTSFFVALSATFPDGERFFIKSVRQYQDQITDPELLKQVKDFTRQEGQHAVQHTELDALMESKGLLGSTIEQDFKQWITDLYEDFSPERRLTRTVCIEHLTALLADYQLTSAPFDGMPNSIKQLMQWHSVEELEHKAVAFDVFMHCVGDRNMLRKEMLVATEILNRITWKYQLKILKANRHIPTPREWRGYIAYYRGFLKSTRQGWLDFFKADFHPWQDDNSPLVQQWKQDNPALQASAL